MSISKIFNPEDCDISAFVFLAGGHFTLHTFSYREAYFVDVLYPDQFDCQRLEELLSSALPSEINTCHHAKRNPGNLILTKSELNPALDFDPHLFLVFNNYHGPKTMESLFPIFDQLPKRLT